MASPTQLLPPPGKDFNDAKRQYMEHFGSALVTNTYLRVAVLCLSVVAVGALVLNFKTYALFKNFKPLVIRINDVGRAEPVEYSSMEYKPQAPEMKYFLTQFVHDYYSRNRATVRDDLARSLFFLDSRLAAARMDQNRKTKEIETFIVEGNEEVEVHVQNIVLQDLRTPPFRATVDFEKVYLSGRDRTEVRRGKYVGSFLFVFKDTVSNSMIPVNPLGLTITYFRDDQAFQESKP
ncbi:MAG: putative conjugal transfer protein [Bryobacterales bacterium]|nr:putative conjugal transfer protein [Bryobacterales bacterium]